MTSEVIRFLADYLPRELNDIVIEYARKQIWERTYTFPDGSWLYTTMDWKRMIDIAIQFKCSLGPSCLLLYVYDGVSRYIVSINLRLIPEVTQKLTKKFHLLPQFDDANFGAYWKNPSFTRIEWYHRIGKQKKNMATNPFPQYPLIVWFQIAVQFECHKKGCILWLIRNYSRECTLHCISTHQKEASTQSISLLTIIRLCMKNIFF